MEVKIGKAAHEIFVICVYLVRVSRPRLDKTSNFTPYWTMCALLHDMQSFIVHSMPVMQTPHFRAERYTHYYTTDTKNTAFATDVAVDCLFLSFFFFKQKTAYEIMPSLVGSEMCIRDSHVITHTLSSRV